MSESGGRKLEKILTLPVEALKTLHMGSSEVRLYRNEISGQKQVGKLVSALGLEEAAVFTREAVLLHGLNHDHIVPVVDVAKVEDPSADPLQKVIEMIMPYYPKGSYCDYLRAGNRFSVGEAIQLTRDVLLGLAELHEGHRWLHRDVKSGNVFIDDRGRGRVGDLGVAIPLDANGKAAPYQSNQLFTAPETLVTATCDVRYDIYGVGLILLELLQGPFPYEEYTQPMIFERLKRGQRGVKTRHLQLLPHVPPRVRTIVNKAVSIDPQQRYESARKMMAALDNVPFIDWRRVDGDGASDDLVWEGTRVDQPQPQYQVMAQKQRRGENWKLVGRKSVTRWQRCVEDQVVSDPFGGEAKAFFDQLLKLALSS